MGRWKLQVLTFWWALLLGAFAPCGAQAVSAEYSWLALDNATAAAVGVLWQHGYEHDPAGRCGMARVLAACRLEGLRRTLPAGATVGMRVGRDYHLVFAVVEAVRQRSPAGEPLGWDESALARSAGRALAALAEPAELDDDLLERVLAQQALAADDAQFLYPGSVLAAAAHAHVWREQGALARPPEGSSAEIAGLTNEHVRQALAAAVPMRVGALGIVPAALRAAAERLPWRSAEAAKKTAGRSSLADARQPSGVLPKELPHRRSDSPWVAAAFVAPVSVDSTGAERAAFALALDLASQRAARSLRLRGQELFARAPLVAWSLLDEDRLAFFCRRGEQPIELLPGEVAQATVADERRATRGELDALLEDLRTRALLPAEVNAARERLRYRFEVPEPGSRPVWGGEPATLPGRLQLLLLANQLRTFSAAELDSVAIEDVARVFSETLAPGRAFWLALLPLPSERAGFRAR
ncbi:MAG: hypothetical protein AB8H80_15015 [Planctomycetota bacterium]